ncbi:Gfo/Idh/MocA family protein [Halobacteriales archaeon Cl-PHB]
MVSNGAASETVGAGVVGVGSMGRHHARVYDELRGVDLVAVADADDSQAEAVAADYDATPMSAMELFDQVDVASIAVPTRFHHDVAVAAIDRGVSVLVEKPFVKDLSEGRDLVERARQARVTLQIGHVERFNPAVQALADIVTDLDVIAVEARRLGPPVDRDSTDSAVMDLMIHDIDVVRSLVDQPVARVAAAGASDGQYITANLRFDDGVVGSLTASRVTQQKIRDLSITAHSCRVHVDYADQSVSIHRKSVPEYVEADGDVRFRHESLIEQPTVDNGEPLKAELRSFVEAAVRGTEPEVTGEDGLRAVELATEIDALAKEREPPATHGVSSL